MRPAAIDASKAPPLSAEARAVHEAAIIIDLHADTPKLMSRGYDIYKHHRTPWPVRHLVGHVDLPRMRAGGQGGQFFAMWTFPGMARGCNAEVHRQLDAVDAAVQGGDGLRLCRSAAEVRAARAQGQVAILMGMEGGQALEGGAQGSSAVEQLERFARRGVRYLGPLHFSKNALGTPAKGLGMDAAAGLTALGCEVVDACQRLGVIIDLTHINRRGFFEVLERTRGPLFVTHTGVAGVTAHWRNLDDEQIRAVADRGGAVGVIFAPRFLGLSGIEGVVAHLLHVVRIGGEDAVALGSDWDGFVNPPAGLADPSELPNLTEALLRAGLRPEAVHKLLGGNVLRVLEAVPPRA